ncbi:hypothetical protein ACFODW_11570 [Virgibacillus sediminis]|uniref:Uncharacterized protein n=1 Tax=Virgibacillus sediminis TaxID=202260 RepID=A0ABV7A803_9BACI
MAFYMGEGAGCDIGGGSGDIQHAWDIGRSGALSASGTGYPSERKYIGITRWVSAGAGPYRHQAGKSLGQKIYRHHAVNIGRSRALSAARTRNRPYALPGEEANHLCLFVHDACGGFLCR